MVSIPTNIKNIIDRYLELLKKQNIPIQHAVLFGSYAKGTFKEWSDIDIALVSDIFIGDRIKDKDLVRSLTLSVSSQIEVIPFASKDFISDDPFVKEILETGVSVI